MTVITFVPGIVAVVGLLIYLMASKAEVKEIGRISFFCGLLVMMFVLAGNKVVL